MSTSPQTREVSRGRSMAVAMGDFRELAKPRITMMVVLSAVAGFWLGSFGAVDVMLLLHTALGMALVVGSSNALNQVLERDPDARMRRTLNRPLPAGRMSPGEVMVGAALAAVAGGLYLALAVNGLTALLTLTAWAIYLTLYTPLKRRSSVSTLIGAIAGALPPMAGWVAAQGEVSPEAWVLFFILFFWQLPHFLAIAWMYREDYGRAGFAMLSVNDEGGRRTGGQAVLYTLPLIPVTLLPTVMGLAGYTYFTIALIAGVGFLFAGMRMRRVMTTKSARQLLLVSLIYLPVVLISMIVDRVPW